MTTEVFGPYTIDVLSRNVHESQYTLNTKKMVINNLVIDSNGSVTSFHQRRCACEMEGADMISVLFVSQINEDRLLSSCFSFSHRHEVT